MQRALKIFVMLMAGVALGLGATWVTAIRGTFSGAVSNGPWTTSLYTGSSEGGPYLRARVAVHGLLALSREETVYYTALRDSDGAMLNGNCTYRLEGRDPPTRWWSITAYGADDFLIPMKPTVIRCRSIRSLATTMAASSLFCRKPGLRGTGFRSSRGAST